MDAKQVKILNLLHEKSALEDEESRLRMATAWNAISCLNYLSDGFDAFYRKYHLDKKIRNLIIQSINKRIDRIDQECRKLMGEE